MPKHWTTDRVIVYGPAGSRRIREIHGDAAKVIAAMTWQPRLAVAIARDADVSPRRAAAVMAALTGWILPDGRVVRRDLRRDIYYWYLDTTHEPTCRQTAAGGYSVDLGPAPGRDSPVEDPRPPKGPAPVGCRSARKSLNPMAGMTVSP